MAGEDQDQIEDEGGRPRAGRGGRKHERAPQEKELLRTLREWAGPGEHLVLIVMRQCPFRSLVHREHCRGAKVAGSSQAGALARLSRVALTALGIFCQTKMVWLEKGYLPTGTALWRPNDEGPRRATGW